MEFIETRIFSRKVHAYLNDEDYGRVQKHLISDPASGDVIKGSGGIRKLRWNAAGRGKRGGIRVIYYVAGDRVLLLTLYAKNELNDLTLQEIKLLKRIVEELNL